MKISELYHNILELAKSYNLNLDAEFKSHIMDILDSSIDEIFKGNKWYCDDIISQKEAELILSCFKGAFKVISERSDI